MQIEWIKDTKKLIFKKSAPFNDCTSEINDTQIGEAKDLDVVMTMYRLIKYNDN